MFIIGERINTSREDIEPAVKNRDADFIRSEAERQLNAGADVLDINAGTLVSDESNALKWLTETIQEACQNVSLAIDTPNTEALEAALQVHRGQAVVNSITAEKKRFEKMVPLVKEYECKVIALCMDDNGMPDTADDRIAIAHTLISDLIGFGIEEDNIYIDPLVRPVSTGADYGKTVLETISEVSKRFEKVHTICGLSNISYGLPSRRLLNRSFLISCMTMGLDSVILDPLDQEMLSMLYAAEAVLGRDQYGMNYIKFHRDGRL